MNIRSSSMSRRVAGGELSGTENWLCPPWRLRYMTSWRATSRATSSPRSSATSASVRSMQALIPAPVHTFPLRTKIGSGSTRTAG